MDVASVSDLIAKAGVIPLLVLGLVILGREYRRKERACDYWQQLAFKALTSADKSATLAEFFHEAAAK